MSYSQSTSGLTAAEESSLTELFLRGVKELGVPTDLNAESLIPVLRAGLQAAGEFAQEMIDGRTDRAQLAREALCAEVYGRFAHLGARERFLRRAEDRARDESVVRARKELGL